MNWFNYIGLIVVILMMIPNIIYAFKHPSKGNDDIPGMILVFENISRYGCMIFMVFNIPYTWYSFFFDQGLIVYIVGNAILVSLYIVLFILYWNKSGLQKALFLSIIPSLIFLFSGFMILSVPLFALAFVFAFTHIYISIKNRDNL